MLVSRPSSIFNFPNPRLSANCSPRVQTNPVKRHKRHKRALFLDPVSVPMQTQAPSPKFSSVLHTPIHVLRTVCIVPEPSTFAVLYRVVIILINLTLLGRFTISRPEVPPLLACEQAQPRVNRLVPHWRRPNHGVHDEPGSGRLGNLWNRGINGLPVTACTMTPDSASRGT